MQHLHDTSTTRKLQHQICPTQIIFLYELCFLKMYSIAENKLIQGQLTTSDWAPSHSMRRTMWRRTSTRPSAHSFASFAVWPRCSPCNHHFLGQGSPALRVQWKHGYGQNCLCTSCWTDIQPIRGAAGVNTGVVGALDNKAPELFFPIIPQPALVRHLPGCCSSIGHLLSPSHTRPTAVTG